MDEDVTSETSALTTQDKFLISDVSNTGNPNHFVTGATLRSFAGAGFDIHDHATSQLANPNDNDRLAVSDEDMSGDPMRYITLGQIAAHASFDLHDDVTTNLTSISTADRMLITDESGSGDPMRYVNVSQLDSQVGIIATRSAATSPPSTPCHRPLTMR